jgi:hypothetical protein
MLVDRRANLLPNYRRQSKKGPDDVNVVTAAFV